MANYSYNYKLYLPHIMDRVLIADSLAGNFQTIDTALVNIHERVTKEVASRVVGWNFIDGGSFLDSYTEDDGNIDGGVF